MIKILIIIFTINVHVILENYFLIFTLFDYLVNTYHTNLLLVRLVKVSLDKLYSKYNSLLLKHTYC